MVRRILFLLVSMSVSTAAFSLEVNITRELDQFTVKHADREVTVLRNQDTGATIVNDFSLTSRPCPPFCAQPMQVAPQVKTIGEVELMAFMQKKLAGGSGVLIDARTEKWHKRGTIPGSINIPFTHLNPAPGS